MTNILYKVTKKLHKVIEAKSKKFGFSIYARPGLLISPSGAIESKIYDDCGHGKIDKKTALKVVDLAYVTHILQAFNEFLGLNPDWENEQVALKKLSSSEIDFGIKLQNGGAWIAYNFYPKTKSEALWLKWFKPDFENEKVSRFDRAPELVLDELLEILQTL